LPPLPELRRLEPRRIERSSRAPTRTASWREQGWLAAAVAVAVAFCVVVFTQFELLMRHGNWFRIGFMAFTAAIGYLGYRWRRATLPSAEQSRALDARPAILLLRAFGRDGAMTKVGIDPTGDYEIFGDRLGALVARSGPVHALVRPGTSDGVPLSSGAIIAARDPEWQQSVLAAAVAAPLVFVVLDPTIGLLWEMETLLADPTLRAKTIVMVDHDAAARPALADELAERPSLARVASAVRAGVHYIRFTEGDELVDFSNTDIDAFFELYVLARPAR
jgi:hypothetical protein